MENLPPMEPPPDRFGNASGTVSSWKDFVVQLVIVTAGVLIALLLQGVGGWERGGGVVGGGAGRACAGRRPRSGRSSRTTGVRWKAKLPASRSGRRISIIVSSSPKS